MTYLRKVHTASRSYFDELRRIEREILSIISKVKPRVIVDIGVGESTINLLSNQWLVIAVDSDCSKLVEFHRKIGSSYERLNRLMLACGDASYLPLRQKSIDLVLFYFVLHEINPRLHLDVLACAKKVSKHIMIAEPVPSGNEMYRKLCNIWQNAMKSVGKFEEYREPEYWLTLLERLSMNIVEKKIISWRTAVPYEALKTMVELWIDGWKRIGVPKKFVEQLEMFLEETKVGEFKWSDILVILALSA
ncbi:MAG: class I SAM-dependent methyltransferase [Candidatus Methanodesulfokora sp.]